MAPRKKLRVASVQMESRPGDKEANFTKLERFVASAARRGVQLLLFPECCLTGYWFIRNLSVPQLQELAEAIPAGPSANMAPAVEQVPGFGSGGALRGLASWSSLVSG